MFIAGQANQLGVNLSGNIIVGNNEYHVHTNGYTCRHIRSRNPAAVRITANPFAAVVNNVLYANGGIQQGTDFLVVDNNGNSHELVVQ